MSDESTDRGAAALDAVPRTYDQAVLALATAHAVGPDHVDIYCFADPQRRTVRLIEVSEAFPEGAVDRPVLPKGLERVVPVFPMGPAQDFPFRSEIVQITPAEWEQLRQGKLKLNRDWGDLNTAQRVPHVE